MTVKELLYELEARIETLQDRVDKIADELQEARDTIFMAIGAYKMEEQ